MTIREKLSQIRERNERGGPRIMQLGGDPNAKVWPAETWRVCDSQADVAPLLEAVEAVMEFMEETPYGAHGDYGAPMVHTDDIHRIIEHHLGGGEDGRS